MARTMNRLSDRGVKALKDKGVYSDGGGLYLRIDAAGAKRWVFIFQWNKRRSEMGLGGVTTVKLAEARQAAEIARKQVRDGVNPITARKASLAAQTGRTFGEVADLLVESWRTGWRNPKHAEQWVMTLREYVTFRDRPIDAVSTDDVLRTFQPMWLAKPETARRLRGRIERVLDAARAREWRTGENPARWRGHLDMLLPMQNKLTRGHHAAMPYPDVAAFMGALIEREAMAARALAFTILTAARTGEAIGATWKEVDLEAGVWIVPAERMKAKREHRVPLSPAAVEILKPLAEGVNDPHQRVFHNGKRDGDTMRFKPLSNMAMTMLMRRMGHAEITVHGFRSTFRDWAAESTTFPREVAEQALAHIVGSETERAYRRGDAFEKRRKMMEAWASFLARPAGAKVVPMRRPAD